MPNYLPNDKAEKIGVSHTCGLLIAARGHIVGSRKLTAELRDRRSVACLARVGFQSVAYPMRALAAICFALLYTCNAQGQVDTNSGGYYLAQCYQAINHRIDFSSGICIGTINGVAATMDLLPQGERACHKLVAGYLS